MCSGFVRSLVLAGFVIAFMPPVTAQGTTVVGEWDDTVGPAWQQNIQIVQEKTSFYRVSRFPKGKPSRVELEEVKPRPGEKRRFRVLQSDDGEAYAIAANGNLRLFDNEGFIREAKRVR